MRPVRRGYYAKERGKQKEQVNFAMRPSECDGLAVATERRHVSLAQPGRAGPGVFPSEGWDSCIREADGTLRESRGRATKGLFFPHGFWKQKKMNVGLFQGDVILWRFVWPGNRRSGCGGCGGGVVAWPAPARKTGVARSKTRELGRRDRQSHGLGDHANHTGRGIYTGSWR